MDTQEEVFHQLCSFIEDRNRFDLVCLNKATQLIYPDGHHNPLESISKLFNLDYPSLFNRAQSKGLSSANFYNAFDSFLKMYGNGINISPNPETGKLIYRSIK